MSTREEISELISYVLSERNRELLVKSGLESVPPDIRVCALRGLQDLGWISASGLADFEESYSLTKEGRVVFTQRPDMDELAPCVRDHVAALRLADSEINGDKRQGLKQLIEKDIDLGNWDSALIRCYDLKRLAEKHKDAELAAFALFSQGRVEVAQNRWDDALESNLDALQKYMDCGDRKGVCVTNRALGVIYANKGENRSARSCFETSVSMARSIGDRDAEAKAEGNLANIFDIEGRAEEAEEAHRRCLDYFLEKGDMVSAARTANNLGVLNMSRETYQTAAEYFDKTITSCRLAKNKEILGIALVNSGYCHARTGNTGRSVKCTDEAVSIFREPNNSNMLALAYRNYGFIELRNGAVEKSIEWFDKSVRSARTSGVESTMAACYYDYGVALIKVATNPRLAAKLLKKAVSIYDGLGNLDKARAAKALLASA